MCTSILNLVLDCLTIISQHKPEETLKVSHYWEVQSNADGLIHSVLLCHYIVFLFIPPVILLHPFHHQSELWGWHGGSITPPPVFQDISHLSSVLKTAF